MNKSNEVLGSGSGAVYQRDIGRDCGFGIKRRGAWVGVSHCRSFPSSGRLTGRR
jgi:hypothetical protein